MIADEEKETRVTQRQEGDFLLHSENISKLYIYSFPQKKSVSREVFCVFTRFTDPSQLESKA